MGANNGKLYGSEGELSFTPHCTFGRFKTTKTAPFCRDSSVIISNGHGSELMAEESTTINLEFC